MALTLWPTKNPMRQLSATEIAIRDADSLLSERLWLPWYEEFGPSFIDHLRRYPREIKSPPQWQASVVEIGPGKLFLST